MDNLLKKIRASRRTERSSGEDGKRKLSRFNTDFDSVPDVAAGFDDTEKEDTAQQDGFSVSVVSYTQASVVSSSFSRVEDALKACIPRAVNWISVYGLDDSEQISQLASAFDIHPLTVEDLRDTSHRPKFEYMENYFFCILKMIWADITDSSGDAQKHNGLSVRYGHFAAVLCGSTVITFEEKPYHMFDRLRNRIHGNYGRIRKSGSNYLMYALMDTIVDNYFSVLETLGTVLEEFENHAVDDTDTETAHRLQAYRLDLNRFRRAVWPLRESIVMLDQSGGKLMTPEISPFFKDLHENVLQIVETIESYREMTAAILDINLSAASNRMNQIMKVLTIISTIFIPLSFITGIFGMNFAYMRWLQMPYGYPVTVGVMVLIGAGMIVYFRKKGWL